MGFSLVYLMNWAGYRILEFFRHWYINAFLYISRKILGLLERLDRGFALKITARNFFRPLYQDYTVIGYVMGFFFRFWRVLIASLIYGVVIFLGAIVYFAWAAFPIYIFYKGLI